MHIEPHGGRSSEEAFPFFNLESEASRQGVMVAVGWTGTWFADLEKRDPNRLTLAAGMLNTDLYLYPGEQIRTPSVALMFWSGDRMNGHNRSVRIFKRQRIHVAPNHDGRPRNACAFVSHDRRCVAEPGVHFVTEPTHRIGGISACFHFVKAEFGYRVQITP